MFPKRTKAEETSNEVAIEEYLTFTASPTRDRGTRKNDFQKISQLQGLVDFGTNGKNILIAQTEVITIVDPGTKKEHEIGSFLIYVIRARHGRMWTVEFRFENTTRIVGECMHPHIRVSEYKGISRKTGYLCIQRGQHGVYQAIREARIPDALSQLIDILYMFHSRPFLSVSHWPIVGENK